MKTIKEMKTLDRMRETYIPEKAERLDEEKMKWFRDSKFGMFIHWGLYSGLCLFCAGGNGGRPPDCSGEFRRHLYGSGDHTGNCRDRAGEEKGQGYLLKISPPLFPRRGGAGSMRGPKGGCEKNT